MRNLLWLSCLVLAASCDGKSNAVLQPSATGGAGGAGSQSGAGGGPQGTAAQTAATGGASATGTGGESRVVTGLGGDSGAGGASATAGSGGTSERDAGQGGAGQAGHDGGQGGAGGSAPTVCDQIKTDYAVALHQAQMCDPHASAQCQQLAVRSLGCYCTTTVSDATTLDDLKARYDQEGCPADPACRGIFCTSPGTGMCISIDSGDLCN